MPRSHKNPDIPLDPFYEKFKGSFTSCMRWDDLTVFWQQLKQSVQSDIWHIYAIGEDVPHSTVSTEEFIRFIDEIDSLLRREHDEDYCGIVYADNKADPSYIKIYDPNNLGVSCGFSDNPPLPGWILSIIPPKALEDKSVLTQQRKRWWDKFWKR